MQQRRRAYWETGTREALRECPEDVRGEFGQGLYLAEQNKLPPNGSPMRGRLAGVVELASDEEGDTYRLYYTLKCPGFVYVLYCHKKKSKQGSEIPKHEEDVIAKRYKDAVRDCP
ncbi:MAG TPA: type II toxin-antitoxin system RelE/ParE family toxin [Longimicrobium sp.]|nr:type II toxin-antitoxin system RelE/ParE family toxin [Longimicrobium sp.]